MNGPPVLEFNETAYNSYLNSLEASTKRAAEFTVTQYKTFCDDNGHGICDIASVGKFADYLHTEEELLTSSIWSYLSHINAFFEFGLQIIIKNADPTIKRKLKLWQKNDETKKADIFTKEDIQKFIKEAPDSIDYLIKKVCLIIGVFGLLRLNEIHSLQWSNVVQKDDVFLITVIRSKRNSPKKPYVFFVYGEDNCNKLIIYRELMKNNLNGNLFRKLSSKGNPGQNIGENKLREYGVDIATYLQLPNPKRFTGHTYRRSGATITEI